MYRHHTSKKYNNELKPSMDKRKNITLRVYIYGILYVIDIYLYLHIYIYVGRQMINKIAAVNN